MSNAHILEPILEMREGTPISAAFGDVYFSREGGVAETEHVFLAANGLPGRWQRAAKKAFSIGELGFGTGLNFLVTLQHFRAHARAEMTLHYHAVEKFPLRPETLAPLLKQVPELADEAGELLARYPLRLPGPHRLVFDRAVLTLWFGEVTEWLTALPAQSINAWYLDGFAPAKNPEMWSEAVFAGLTRTSADGASFATFTAASAVRRGLEAAGFAVEKVPGFGRKREMLKGVIRVESRESSEAEVKVLTRLADMTRAFSLDSRLSTLITPILILGAGIAGASLARALADRGYAVTVLERETVAGGASGNAAGVLFPPLTKRWTAQTAFYFAAYDHMLRSITKWQTSGLTFATAAPGMLRLPRNAEEEAHLTKLEEVLGLDPSIVHWLNQEAASEKAGVALSSGGAYFPHGTWLSPRELCTALLDHPNIIIREKTAAAEITRNSNSWSVTLEHGERLLATILCLAAAHGAANLLADFPLTLNPVGGQVSEFPAHAVSTPLRSILCHKGYVIPCGDHYLTGATYHREELLEVTASRHAENLAELHTIVPGWFHGEASAGRSAIRATTPSRVPYIGQLAQGLYVSTGHGSRGLLSAPLAAEIIASSIAGEMSPVTPDVSQWLAQALHQGLQR